MRGRRAGRAEKGQQRPARPTGRPRPYNASLMIEREDTPATPARRRRFGTGRRVLVVAALLIVVLLFSLRRAGQLLDRLPVVQLGRLCPGVEHPAGHQDRAGRHRHRRRLRADPGQLVAGAAGGARAGAAGSGRADRAALPVVGRLPALVGAARDLRLLRPGARPGSGGLVGGLAALRQPAAFRRHRPRLLPGHRLLRVPGSLPAGPAGLVLPVHGGDPGRGGGLLLPERKHPGASRAGSGWRPGSKCTCRCCWPCWPC